MGDKSCFPTMKAVFIYVFYLIYAFQKLSLSLRSFQFCPLIFPHLQTAN